MGIVDCQFEGDLCKFFNTEGLPALYLFKDNKIWLMNELKVKDITVENLLHYLSGDNYKEESNVAFEDAGMKINHKLGMA